MTFFWVRIVLSLEYKWKIIIVAYKLQEKKTSSKAVTYNTRSCVYLSTRPFILQAFYYSKRKEQHSALVILRKEKKCSPSSLLAAPSGDQPVRRIARKPFQDFDFLPLVPFIVNQEAILPHRSARRTPDGGNTVYLFAAFGSDGPVSPSPSSSLGSSDSKVKCKKATTTSTTAAGATGFRPESGFRRLATR